MSATVPRIATAAALVAASVALGSGQPVHATRPDHAGASAKSHCQTRTYFRFTGEGKVPYVVRIC